MTERFRDPGTELYELAAQDILVVCPRCRHRAVVTPVSTEAGWATTWPRRLVCPSCTHTESWARGDRPTRWGGPIDPFFGQPLWLTATCCGDHLLWAYNAAHLDLLGSYVEARLRERGPVPGSMSVIEKLPAWIKAARHRDELLRVITRLRATLG